MTAVQGAAAEWISTTRDRAWESHAAVLVEPVGDGMPDVIAKMDQPRQSIDGFGACFNELGWTALSRLPETTRDEVLREIFTPGVGAGLSLCRMPIGANDFSTDWYSYDELPGDFSLEHFDISHDLDTLVPFIHAAQRQRADLRLWASPWSPPTWMKTNGHYAGALSLDPDVDTGLRPDQVQIEGTDTFVLDEEHLTAYARYFGRFVDSYRDLGIRIDMVMPQNEFNSAQVFPSCTWTPDGLARFVRHLIPEMSERSVQIFLGTLERGDDHLFDAALSAPHHAAAITGVGVQWEGKRAIAALRARHPELRIYQTEQECGNGDNDWRQARHAWSLMRHFFDNGANAYSYWNIALDQGGRSRWGWTQNSLVTVDPEDGSHRFTPDYFVLKHVSAFVQTGAHVIETWSLAGYANQLVFLNPDGSIVVAIQNDLSEDLPVRILLGDRTIHPTLPADSFNTFLVPAAALEEIV